MPVAGSSRERQESQDVKPRQQPDSSEDDDDDDADFGRRAIEQVRLEAAQVHRKALHKKYKDLKAEYHKAGLPPPPKPEAHVKALKRQRSVAPLRYDDDRGGRKPPARKRSRRTEESNEDDDTSDDQKSVPTASTFDPRKKSRDLYAKHNIKLSPDLSDPETRGTETHRRIQRSEDPAQATKEEIEAHLRRKWVYKEQPEAMSLYRKRMEEMYNPLIRLLNIKILVTNGDSDDEKGAHLKARVHMNTDSEGSDEDMRRRRRRKTPQPKSLGNQPSSENRDSNFVLVGMGMLDDEPPTEDEEGSPPPAKTSLKLEFETDVEPTLPAQEDYEPTTEEEDDMSATRDTMLKVDLDNEEEGDEMSRMVTASVAARRETTRREEQHQLRLQAEQLRAQVRAAQLDSQQTAADGSECEVTVVERNGQPSVRAEFPRPVPKGRRPRLELQNEEQARRGPHPLHPADGSQPKHEVPAPVNRFLRDYQREGVEFLHRQYSKGLGGILGDDMGLGKTIQVIAFLSAVMDKKGTRKHDHDKRRHQIQRMDRGRLVISPSDLGPTCLIICPASVVHNWARELNTWSYLSVGVYEGSKSEVLMQFQGGFYDVLIAGFESARGDIDILELQDFSIVIIDEVHRVKNPVSGTTKAMKRFRTPFKYGLTALHIPRQDYVSSPLKVMHSANATDEELATGRARALALVGELLPNFWLRRTKFDPSVKLQLPPKIDHVVLCPLTPLQLLAYRRLLQLEDVQVMLTAHQPCPCGAVDGDGLPFERGKCCKPDWAKLIFKYMDLFRKVSNHLALIYPDPADKDNGNRAKYIQDRNWVQAAFPEDWEDRRLSPLVAFEAQLCGKWQVLTDMLDVWKENGDKVLIFTLSLKIIDLLRSLFEFHSGFSYRVLDGSVPSDERMELVDQFNDLNGDVFVFILSTRAGGVGLNLTAANRVVIFDPNWNPSHDLQAMDRSYRFGQTRDVNVYRFVAAGTIEELIINRQQNKRAMANIGYDANAERRLYEGVEGFKDREGELYGVKNIFKLTENYSMTTKAIQRCDLADQDAGAAAVIGGDDEDEDGQTRAAAGGDDDALAGLVQRDARDFVKDLAGLTLEEETELTPEERAKRAKLKSEQAKIAEILGLSRAIVVNSDATLGSHKREEDRARRLFQQGLHDQNRGAFPEQDVGHRKDSKPPAGRSKKLLPSPTGAEWNPLKRRRKKQFVVTTPGTPRQHAEPESAKESTTSIKADGPPLIESDQDTNAVTRAEPMQASHSTTRVASDLSALMTRMYTTCRKENGIPGNVTLRQLVAHSQYHDIPTLMRALLRMPSDADRFQVIECLCDGFIEANL
ncbi:hypothetical protein OIV83_004718 [Microbotryomycetes sp. JL201]|nr:hypothetical protein OIV83_004718 [Microbotryomycetes sp. JL201]